MFLGRFFLPSMHATLALGPRATAHALSSVVLLVPYVGHDFLNLGLCVPDDERGEDRDNKREGTRPRHDSRSRPSRRWRRRAEEIDVCFSMGTGFEINSSIDKFPPLCNQPRISIQGLRARDYRFMVCLAQQYFLYPIHTVCFIRDTL